MFYYDTKQWMLLIAMAAALSLIFIDQTAISIALPTIQKAFSLNYTDVQWVMNIYAVCLASTLIVGGKLADYMGPKTTYQIGIVFFGLGSLLCGSVSTYSFLLFGRVIQGLSAAIMLPAAAVLVINHFPESERGRAIGFYVGIASVFLALGPMFGGLLLQSFGWYWIFYINIPICLLGLIFAKLVLTEQTYHKQFKFEDFTGYLLISLSLASLITALIESNRHGFGSLIVMILFTVSLIGWTVFIWRSLVIINPIINFKLFKNKTFAICCWIMLQDQAVVVSITFWMLILQYGYLKSPAYSGLLLLTGTFPIIFMAPLSGICRDQFGPILTMRIGAILMCCGSWWIGIVIYNNYPLLWLVAGFFCFGSGTPFVLSTAMGQALSVIKADVRGTASGIINTCKQLGTALGLAIWGTIIGHLYFSFLAKILHKQNGYAGLTVKSLHGLLVQSKSAMQAISHLPLVQQEQLLAQAQLARRESFGICMACVGTVALISFLMTWWMPRQPRYME